MRLHVLGLALLCAPLAMASAAKAERRYDCSKPGNAAKAACKTTPSAAPASTTAAPSAPAPSTTAVRRYDCSKAGNADKAVCKGAAAPSPATVAASPASASKPSIFGRMLKPMAPPAPPQAAAAPAQTVATAPAASHNVKSITTDAAGATGQCKDGTYTHATHHSGACSSHGGVAKWM